MRVASPFRRPALPTLEPLESRLAPACTATLPNTTLLITCDQVSDNVALNHAGTNTLVLLNGRPTAPWPDSRINAIQVSLGGGNDTVNVLANVRPITIDSGTGTNTVNLGNARSTRQIRAAVEVRSLGGYAALTVNDSAGQPPRSIGLSNRLLTGLAPAQILFTAAELTSLTIRAGAGGNTINVTEAPQTTTTLFAGSGNDLVRVQATPAGTALTVNTEAGNDVVLLGSVGNTLGTLQGQLRVRGQTGNDRLELQDRGTTAAQTYTLTAQTITRPGMGTVSYETMDALDLFAGGGSDEFNVLGTAAGTQTALHGGQGDDRFGAGTLQVSLDAIQGPLRFVGESGRNQVTITDSAAFGDQSYSIEVGSFDRPFSEIITLDGISVWFFTASGGNDWLRILFFDPSVNLHIDMGDGEDLISGPDLPNSWNLTGQGTGALNLSTTFTAVENLRGGVDSDTFSFSSLATAGVSGYLDGGLGANTLDYVNRSVEVFVDLLNFLGTSAGAVYNFGSVFGGSGNDYLHGDGAANVLVGNEGHDILVGDGDADRLLGGIGRDLLLGGDGSDTLEGGDDEDLLIDGFTNYDYNPTALVEILTEWRRTDLVYTSRIDNLRTGTGLSTYLVDAANVAPDGLPDLLHGLAEWDWFWGDWSDPQDLVEPEVLN